ARPDPESLARWLFQKELASDYSFSDALSRYEGLLGEHGMDAYRRLAEAEWPGVPPLNPGERDRQEFGRRYRLTRVMEQLALRTGDVEELVAVKCRDLSRPDRFLDIARIYLEHGDTAEAVEWAERGEKAFPGPPHHGLAAF